LLQRMYAAMPTERWQYESHNVAWTLAQKWLQKQHAQTDRLRILDVGAFDGAFLKTLPSTWDRQAIEPSAAARRDLEQAGVACVTDFLSQPRQEDAGTFDVVTMFDVFEHLPNPSDSLNHALAYLKPSGHLLLSTGNCDHWTWRLLGGWHWYVTTPQHIVFGNDRYFRTLAQTFNAQLRICDQHPHQNQPVRRHISQIIESLVFAGRQSTSWLFNSATRALLYVPGFGAFRHRESAPYSPAIPDHIFVVIQKN
ncbi:MAG: class I SAM-dependent methyltransferase, partial [Planctomycetaceae bacterium]|nr:class I SAM-dependent methyltransferase [Planctomycetaceae bacterium]